MNKKTNLKSEDFYLENGKFVFTEGFLIKRGYCCGSGCRHCPYTKKNKSIDSMVINGQEHRTTKTNN